MQRSFTRLPWRRCIHTVPPPPPHRFSSFKSQIGLGIALSAAAGSYFAWRWTRYEKASITRKFIIYSKHSLPSPLRTKPAPNNPPQKVTTINTNAGVFQATSADQLPPAHSSDSIDSESTLIDTLSIPTDQVKQQLESESDSEPESEEVSVGQGGENGGGAIDPVTGEINWDCPCLGGMAHGPCGPQFKAAFSCFVYSSDEPKGINCVDMFKEMQSCFREHPDVYAEGERLFFFLGFVVVRRWLLNFGLQK